MTADIPVQWSDRYLRHLGVERERPSLAALTRLIAAQVRRVPFENVSSLLRARASRGRTPPLDPEAVLENWEEGRGGGICFEVAEMLTRLLTSLGYDARPVLSQISFPGSHQAVLVQLDEGRFLADAGNGAPFFAPIRLEGSSEVRGAGLAYRFRAGEGDGEWLQDRWIEGAWQQFCRYDLRPERPGERDAAYQRHHTPGRSWVVDSLRLVRCADGTVYALREGELTVYTAGGRTVQPIESARDYRRLAGDIFHLPALPIEEGFAALAELGGRTRL